MQTPTIYLGVYTVYAWGYTGQTKHILRYI